MFYTEKSHVRNLKLLDILFHQPMTSSAKADSRLKDLVDIIFPSLPALIKIHEELNDDMKRKMKENPLVSIRDVADILVRRVSHQLLTKNITRILVVLHNVSVSTTYTVLLTTYTVLFSNVTPSMLQ